jgi:triacylglycerol lipase
MTGKDWLSTFEFDATSVTYSGKNAFSLGKMSYLAYFNKDFIREKAKQWNFTHFRFFDTNITQAFLVADAEKIIVAFRGTDTMKDWLADFDIDLIGGPFGSRVHEGFDRALSFIWKDIQITINALKPRSALDKETREAIVKGTYRNTVQAPSLWFTGHSLGAALAILAVARLREKDQPVHGLYSFGAPRVGDRTFHEKFNADFRSKNFRFVNKNDLVTRVPTRALFYSHVGQLCYFDEDNRLRNDPSYWYRFLDGIKVRLSDVADLDLSTLENHHVENYLIALEKNETATLELIA